MLPSLAHVPVIPMSTRERGLTWEVRLAESDGMPGTSVLEPEWIRTVERKYLGPLITTLPDEQWERVRVPVDALGLDWQRPRRELPQADPHPSRARGRAKPWAFLHLPASSD